MIYPQKDAPSPRHSHGHATVAKSIFIYGGFDRNDQCLDDLHCFDIGKIETAIQVLYEEALLRTKRQCNPGIRPLCAVLPSPQRQNMPNCVSEYAKQDKNMPNVFRNKKTI